MLTQIQKKIKQLEQEIAFLREEVLRDPLTKFWNLRGLQQIFDKAVRPHIYSKDYQFLAFVPEIPKEEPWIKEKILLACAHFLKGLFFPRDFLTRPSERLFVVITVGRNVEDTRALIARLRGRRFPCVLEGKRLSVGYKVGGTNILGADHLNMVLERALSAARESTFYRV
ncbi:GGDEF domain-containing protein [Thermosulfurimonas marina]|uniref:GGDEF domain-containing protein n=1 Tax=Thermosulfurimonas marina TaxID=2047767 RepID=A0A6H1WSR3_9BACT|nr:GGDEF domain-containing protein [Thermosulfurimonas marina]QJA06211.1 GGDEF domain-containing protein [Thermosulfurimonas marina]